MCPAGLLQEALASLGDRLLGSRIRRPVALDYALRSVKFLVLAFFLKAVLLDFSGQAAVGFLQSPYNKVAAVKLLDFWLHPGTLTVGVVGLLVGASVVFESVWCRYLCPYGALLALVGALSPVAVSVRRDADACTDCGRCTQACSNRVRIDETETVRDLECTRCGDCVSACRRDALAYRSAVGSFSPRTVGLGAVLVVLVAVGLAMATGHWHSAVTYQEWARLIPHSDLVAHPPY